MNTISDVSKISAVRVLNLLVQIPVHGCNQRWIIVFGCPDFNSINPLTAE